MSLKSLPLTGVASYRHCRHKLHVDLFDTGASTLGAAPLVQIERKVRRLDVLPPRRFRRRQDLTNLLVGFNKRRRVGTT